MKIILSFIILLSAFTGCAKYVEAEVSIEDDSFLIKSVRSKIEEDGGIWFRDYDPNHGKSYRKSIVENGVLTVSEKYHTDYSEKTSLDISNLNVKKTRIIVDEYTIHSPASPVGKVSVSDQIANPLIKSLKNSNAFSSVKKSNNLLGNHTAVDEKGNDYIVKIFYDNWDPQAMDKENPFASLGTAFSVLPTPFIFISYYQMPSYRYYIIDIIEVKTQVQKTFIVRQYYLEAGNILTSPFQHSFADNFDDTIGSQLAKVIIYKMHDYGMIKGYTDDKNI